MLIEAPWDINHQKLKYQKRTLQRNEMTGVSHKDFENTVAFAVDTGRYGANFINYVPRLERG